MNPVVYFETPQRSERLQLLLYLLRKGDEIPYLRGATGAGKTRFAQQLLPRLGDEYFPVWLNADTSDDMVVEVLTQLGLPPEAVLAWPAGIAEAGAERGVLVVVDDADALSLTDLGALFELREVGVPLLLLGNGGLAQLQGSWHLKFVDLPPFSEAQTAAFVKALDPNASRLLQPEMLTRLHQSTNGLPGPLLAVLAGKTVKPVSKLLGEGHLLKWLGLAVLPILLAGMFFYRHQNGVLPGSSESPGVAPRSDASSLPASPRIPGLQDREAAHVSALPMRPPKATDQALLPILRERAEALRQQQVNASLPRPESTAVDAMDELEAGLQRAVTAVEKPASEGTPPTVAPEPALADVTLVEVRSDSPAAAAKQDVALRPPPAAPVAAGDSAQLASPLSGDAWLRSEPAGHYTLQLVGARDEAAVFQFIARYKVSKPYAIFQRALNGQSWYSLVAGSYPDRDAAVAARAALPFGLERKGVWPRTFGSVHESLLNQ